MSTVPDKLLAEIQRPGGAQVRLAIVQGRSRPTVEISLWSIRTDGTTYQLPGKAVAIRGDELLTVIEALREAASELRLRGDLP